MFPFSAMASATASLPGEIIYQEILVKLEGDRRDTSIANTVDEVLAAYSNGERELPEQLRLLLVRNKRHAVRFFIYHVKDGSLLGAVKWSTDSQPLDAQQVVSVASAFFYGRSRAIIDGLLFGGYNVIEAQGFLIKAGADPDTFMSPPEENPADIFVPPPLKPLPYIPLRR